jgi:hypothetical protein
VIRCSGGPAEHISSRRGFFRTGSSNPASEFASEHVLMQLPPSLHDFRPPPAASPMRLNLRFHEQVGRIQNRTLLPRDAVIHHQLHRITVGEADSRVSAHFCTSALRSWKHRFCCDETCERRMLTSSTRLLCVSASAAIVSPSFSSDRYATIRIHSLLACTFSVRAQQRSQFPSPRLPIRYDCSLRALFFLPRPDFSSAHGPSNFQIPPRLTLEH